MKYQRVGAKKCELQTAYLAELSLVNVVQNYMYMYIGQPPK